MLVGGSVVVVRRRIKKESREGESGKQQVWNVKGRKKKKKERSQ